MTKEADKTAFDKCKPAQKKAILGLIEGRNKTEVARQAGITPTTLHKWLRTDANFNEAIEEETAQTFGDALNAIRAGCLRAANRLMETLNDEEATHSEATQAARVMLGSYPGLKQGVGLELLIEKLEAGSDEH